MRRNYEKLIYLGRRSVSISGAFCKKIWTHQMFGIHIEIQNLRRNENLKQTINKQTNQKFQKIIPYQQNLIRNKNRSCKFWDVQCQTKAPII